MPAINNSISNLSLENSEFQIKRSLYSLQKFKNILSILGFPNVLDFRHFWSKSLFQITSIPLGFYFFLFDHFFLIVFEQSYHFF